ncbi:unnamed protein product [Hymenolepis diminuta]|uniref:Uncharacterized protein n=2 Tax=Hymenolepis diminuta TaxID=6216 RepID=A0A564ZCF7_HYMDI|nr:unnamed protein product [Hymenolepis diminuta]
MPYDPSTPFSQWLKPTDALLAQLPDACKMSALMAALPEDIWLWLQLKGISESSDYNSEKLTLLNLMSITEKSKSALDLFRRRQMPGESHVQFAIAIQSKQDYLVSLRFISGVYPPVAPKPPGDHGTCGHRRTGQGRKRTPQTYSGPTG